MVLSSFCDSHTKHSNSYGDFLHINFWAQPQLLQTLHWVIKNLGLSMVNTTTQRGQTQSQSDSFNPRADFGDSSPSLVINTLHGSLLDCYLCLQSSPPGRSWSSQQWSYSAEKGIDAKPPALTPESVSSRICWFLARPMGTNAGWYAGNPMVRLILWLIILWFSVLMGYEQLV